MLRKAESAAHHSTSQDDSRDCAAAHSAAAWARECDGARLQLCADYARGGGGSGGMMAEGGVSSSARLMASP